MGRPYPGISGLATDRVDQGHEQAGASRRHAGTHRHTGAGFGNDSRSSAEGCSVNRRWLAAGAPLLLAGCDPGSQSALAPGGSGARPIFDLFTFFLVLLATVFAIVL